jgi:predicted AAA+ superfamily ATPase
MIIRAIQIDKLLKPKKVLILYGARRVGKTTLLKEFLSRTKLKYRIDSGDNIRIQHLFDSQDFQTIMEYAEGYDLIAIDEAQQIKNIGMGLKILTDNDPKLKIIVTGSSSFDLSQSVGEPLTGRKRTVILFPLSLLELQQRYNKQEMREQLETFLLYGLYPEIVTTKSKKGKIELLRELVDSYLLKDILSVETIKGSKQMLDMIKLLAFQIGKEVSLTELATQVRLDVKTVARYLDILEKGFVIKRVGAFSRNLRKEIASKSKYYFYDVGVRNAVILQFNAFENRNDVGELFENFVFMERLKANAYLQRIAETYFWRTYDGQEIDMIEERNGRLFAYEVKWSERTQLRIPPSWKATYPNAKAKLINRENFLSFVFEGAK